MQYSEYGTTGCQVSSVGFGGMRFDIVNESNEKCSELLEYAYDKGINYFDTAPGYCEDRSETIFKHALKKLPRDKIFVTSKIMPTSAQTAEAGVEAVKKSLKTMGIDYIDFFHVWCLRKMEHYYDAMKPGGLYEGLLRCQEEGLIRHIPFSSHQTGAEIKTIVESGNFAGVLLGANILNFPYRWDGVEAAHNAGCGVVAMNPLAGGAIPTHEKELSFLAKDGFSVTESALRFMICCPEITVTLNGFTTREHIDTACKIADTGKPFTKEEISEIKKQLGKSMNSVCTGCGYCKKCPQEIDIPSYMQVYNDHHLFGKSDEEMTKQMVFENSWGRLVGREGDYEKCVECGICEEECTQHLPIIQRLKEFSKWK